MVLRVIGDVPGVNVLLQTAHPIHAPRYPGADPGTAQGVWVAAKRNGFTVIIGPALGHVIGLDGRKLRHVR